MDATEGHHGTFYQIALKILNEGFKFDPRKDQYWGSGVYFYESTGERDTGEQNAIEWAERKKRRDGIRDKIAVILSSIEVGNCLNLDYQPHRNLVAKTRDSLLARGKTNVTMSVAINATADVLDTDTVRVTYEPKDTKLFPGSHLYGRVYLVICVRNLKRILSSVICYTEP